LCIFRTWQFSFIALLITVCHQYQVNKSNHSTSLCPSYHVHPFFAALYRFLVVKNEISLRHCIFKQTTQTDVVLSGHPRCTERTHTEHLDSSCFSYLTMSSGWSFFHQSVINWNLFANDIWCSVPSTFTLHCCFIINVIINKGFNLENFSLSGLITPHWNQETYTTI